MEEYKKRANLDFSSDIVDAIKKDVHINELLKSLNNFVQSQTPKYELKMDGSIDIVYSEEYNAIVSKHVDAIKERQESIVNYFTNK